MSPLLRLVMRVVVWGCRAAAALVVLFGVILLFQRGSAAGFSLSLPDIGMLSVLVVLFLLAIYLARNISRELGRQGVDRLDR